jgi:formylglycine-generating enzyme required for sulfatase activity
MYDKRFLMLACLAMAAVCLFASGCNEEDSITRVTASGRVVVTPEPAGMTIDWTLRGPGGFLEQGTGNAAFNDATLGNYTLTWGAVDGYVRPIPEITTLQLVDGATITFTGLYRQDLPSTVTVDCDPDGIGIGWTLTGPGGFTASGSEDQTFSDLPSGQYTILWRSLNGWWSPVEYLASREIFGGELVLTGAYREDIAAPAGYEYIPGGIFTMGSPDDEWGRSTNESLHEVNLTRDLFVKASELTNSAYLTLITWAMGQGYADVELIIAGDDTSFVLVDTLDDARTQVINLQASTLFYSRLLGLFTPLLETQTTLPVSGLTWHGAAAACDWMNLRDGFERTYDHSDWSVVGGDIYAAPGYRLPTEAEWEYLCRAGTNTAFSSGPILNPVCIDPNLARVAWNCLSVSKPVMRKEANAWGLFDMHGNLSEWCQDGWADYPAGAATDPVALPATGYRVVRGGSWIDISMDCRAAKRSRYAPDQGTVFTGLRPVRTVPMD